MVQGTWIKLGAAALIAGAGVAIALLRSRRCKHITGAGAEPAKKKRRASFEEDTNEAAERTSKRREIEAVSILAAAGSTPVSMVGSVPDMSASWSAKTAVSAAQQADAAALARVYDDMAAQLSAGGLNLPAIQAQGQFYGALDSDQPQPLRYADFPTPLEKGAVRLALLLLPPALGEAALQAARAIVAALPPGMKPHITARDSLHITLFMTSQPGDPRPDPFSAFGGQSVAFPLDGAGAARSIPGASPAVLASEQAAFARLAAATPAPTLEVHSVVFAASGCALLCCVDTSGVLAGLRTAMRKAFVGGAAKQSSIFHVTLARALAPRQLAAADVERMQHVCAEHTRKLRGSRFTPRSMWHVQEWQFTTVQGERVEMPFKGLPAGP